MLGLSCHVLFYAASIFRHNEFVAMAPADITAGSAPRIDIIECLGMFAEKMPTDAHVSAYIAHYAAWFAFSES